MSSGGNYVRAPGYQRDPEESDEHTNDVLANESDSDEQEKQQYDKDGCDSSNSSEEPSDDEQSSSEADGVEEQEAVSSGNSTKNPSSEKPAMHDDNQIFIRRMDQFETTLNQILKAIDSNQPLGGVSPETTDRAGISPEPREADNSWNIRNVTAEASTSTASIRWESIQPFPDDVPANRMWEQWTRFIDRFEIAASLSNINDPVKRAQLLFLSMGQKLQGITLAAKLRPSLQEPNCYTKYVENIEAYLRAMVDVTAEHEAFSNLKQEQNEPTITFHARLMAKARLCGYSCVDQDRFIRAQLLKGMRNKELVKAARTFGYETLFIVQSATREETYTAESAQPESSQAFAVARNHQRPPREPQQWKRKREESDDRWTDSKKRERGESSNPGQGRRSRCADCDRLFHKFGSCPATNRNCNSCGKKGHFAVTCRAHNANHLEQKHSPRWTRGDDDDDRKVNP